MLTKFFRKSAWKSVIIPMQEGLQLKKRKKTNTPPSDLNHHRALTGQLHWLTKTIFDIALAVGVCTVVVASISLRRPTSKQLKAFSRYVKRHSSLSLFYIVGEASQITCYSEGNYALMIGFLHDSARVFLFGSNLSHVVEIMKAILHKPLIL